MTTQQVRTASVVVESVFRVGSIPANQLWHELYEAALAQGAASDAMQVDSKVAPAATAAATSTTAATAAKKEAVDAGDGDAYAPVPDARLSLFWSAAQPPFFVSTFTVDPAALIFRLGETMFFRRCGIFFRDFIIIIIILFVTPLFHQVHQLVRDFFRSDNQQPAGRQVQLPEVRLQGSVLAKQNSTGLCSFLWKIPQAQLHFQGLDVLLDTATTLRRCLVELEKRIPTSLLVPGWSTERLDWGKTVMAAADVSTLAAALVLLMEAIKPMVCRFSRRVLKHLEDCAISFIHACMVPGQSRRLVSGGHLARVALVVAGARPERRAARCQARAAATAVDVARRRRQHDKLAVVFKTRVVQQGSFHVLPR
jgi:hypothetical protein